MIDPTGGGRLWAVTTFFNPEGFRRRAENFRRFRSNLAAPLILVELAFEGVFEFGPTDAEIYVPVSGGDRMWQKERLTNLGLAHLPSECEAVALLDGDIEFERQDWVEATLFALESHSIVQLFHDVHHLSSDECGRETMLMEPGVAAWQALGNSIEERIRPGVQRGKGKSLATGFGWALRREAVRHGMYDRCIVGGGDTALVCAAFDIPDIVLAKHRMNPLQVACYREWANQFCASAGRVGCVPGSIQHYWHGAFDDRKPESRHEILERHLFDPYRDISIHPSGAWQWSSDKPQMHLEVCRYFAMRNEDSPAARK